MYNTIDDFWYGMTLRCGRVAPTPGVSTMARRNKTEQRDVNTKMVPQELLLRAVEAAHHGIYITDAQGRIQYANPAFLTLTGYGGDEILGRPISILSSGEMPAEYYQHMWESIRSGRRWQEEIVNRRRDGSLYCAFQVIAPVTESDGSISAYVGIQHDISAEKEIRRTLDRTIIEFDAIFSNTQDALVLVDVEKGPHPFRMRKLSATFERLTGLTTDRVRGKTPEEIYGEDEAAAISGRYRECVERGFPISYEETLALPMGRRIWHTQLSPVRKGNDIVQLVGSSRDITDRKKIEEDLRYLSEVDPLTGVPNRRKIAEELDRELARAHRHSHPLSVLMSDVDHFKTINDEFGHDAGDSALRGIATTIRESLRPADRVGRWGGEEFVIVLPETDRAGALATAERVRLAVEGTPILTGRSVTVSIGIASLGAVREARPRALSHTVDSLVRIADEELYRAKDQGRNRVSG